MEGNCLLPLQILNRLSLDFETQIKGLFIYFYFTCSFIYLFFTEDHLIGDTWLLLSVFDFTYKSILIIKYNTNTALIPDCQRKP